MGSVRQGRIEQLEEWGTKGKRNEVQVEIIDKPEKERKESSLHLIWGKIQ